MSEIDEVFTYLNQHPTAAEILAVVYEVKTKSVGLEGFKIDQGMFEKDLSEVAAIPKMSFERLSPEFAESIRWVQEKMTSLKIH